MNLYCPTTSRPRILLALDRRDERLKKGVARFAAEQGWILEDQSDYELWMRRIVDWQGDGIIADPGFSLPVQPLTRLINYRRIPSVSLQSFGTFLGSASVLLDYRAIGSCALEHIVSQGYEQAGFVAFEEDEHEAELLSGFSVRAERLGISVEVIPFGNLERRLSGRAKRIGLFAPSDRKASSVSLCCAQLGLKSPAELGVVGVGNDEKISELANVSLSSVDLDREEWGYEAARALGDLMQGGRPKIRTQLIAPRGVVGRGSTARRSESEKRCVETELTKALGQKRNRTRQRLSCV